MDRKSLGALNLIGASIANSLAENMSVDEINVLAQLFCVIGDALALLGTADH